MYMKVRRINIIPVIAAALIAAFSISCKKKEEPAKALLNGTLKFVDFPHFMECGSRQTVKVKGITHPLNKKMKVVFTFKSLRDTLVYDPVNGTEYILFLPEEYADLTINATIIPEDSDKYAQAYASETVTTVDSEESLPEVMIRYEDEVLMDMRDAALYPYRTIGEQDWMRKNVYYSNGNKLGVMVYDKIMDPLMGRLYTWEEAQGVCPEGWSLPTDEDFRLLASYLTPGAQFTRFTDFKGAAGPLMADAYFNNKRMWYYNPEVKMAEDPQFSAIPVGFFVKGQSNAFRGYQELACFWTSDDNPSDSSQAMYRYISTDSPNLMSGSADKKSMAMSVRCMRKSESEEE